MSHTPDRRTNTVARSPSPVAEVSTLDITTPGGRPLLKNVSLTLRPGRLVAVTGPSGAGKTTLLRALLGHLPPGTAHSAGQVRVLGHDMFELDERARREVRRTRIGYVGQDPASVLNPRLRVRTLLRELNTDRSPAAVRDLLDAVRLPADHRFTSRRPGELSGGQLRRVALARVLVKRPTLLLLDEPTAGLDPVLRHEITELLRSLTHEHDLGVAFSSHDPDVVERLADDVVRLAPDGAVPEAPEERGERPSGRIAVSRRSPAASATGAETAGVPLLDVHDLSVALGRRSTGHLVLDGVRLTVAKGSVAAVVGASGSGKTTLARALVGLHKSLSGTVRLDGTALPATVGRRSRDQRRRIQLITQNPLGALNPSRTVGSSVARPLRIHHRTPPGITGRAVEELLRQVGLPADFADRYPHELSGGQRQRVAIARALAAEPEILVCDEITSALDRPTGHAVMDLLHRLRQDRSMTLVIISHDVPLIRDRSETITVLADGRVVESGRTADVFADPRHAATAELLSGPATSAPTSGTREHHRTLPSP
ncbi:ABC transporter ATP-binding protein [Streptomyces sp. NPDC057620]|uniref:ABC transporter ATP-binding protein n=1 Tax=Streptomyces sp. NPDC057620 TaxID=3346185 RepID=UPI0036828C55